MDRADFLKSLGLRKSITPEPSETIEEKLMNKAMPLFRKLGTGLDPMTSPLSKVQAAHLLRRATFGPTAEQIENATGRTIEEIMDDLLEDLPEPSAPVATVDIDPVGVGNTWVDEEFHFDSESARHTSMVSWWYDLMLKRSGKLTEKMTIFWHNHFVTELNVVFNARYYYRYIKTLRKNSLGNFKDFVHDITKDPTMLFYLNGNDNVKGAPNENYAREFLELFTIGKGEQRGAGDYTHYTEQDVLAAAKVLTGWRIQFRPETFQSEFQPSLHEPGSKQFSSAFGNKVIEENGEEETNELIDMVFDQKETARHICRKIYRWFVYYAISPEEETSIIEPLADHLIDSNFEIKPVLRKLFSSEHFFDSANIGCLIKNPIDMMVGMVNQLEMILPSEDQVVERYNTAWLLHYGTYLTEMILCNPPGVAGWKAYYQIPQYHQIWINSVTMPFRKFLTDIVNLEVGLSYEGARLRIEHLDIVKKVVSDPSDPSKVVDEIAALIFPVEITDTQKNFYKSSLKQGVSDEEYANEWQLYLDDPDTYGNAVRVRIFIMLLVMMASAEFHLS